MKRTTIGRLTRAALFGATILTGAAQAFAEIDTLTADNNGQLPLPTGQYVTPTLITGANLQFLNPHLANYPDFVAGIASRSAVSPDGTTLLIATNGYNSLNDSAGKTDPAASNQYVFVFDISGANRTTPSLTQVVQVPNIYEGLIWASNTRFYVSGGVDDVVRAYDLGNGGFTNTATIALGHTTGLGSGVKPNSAGLSLAVDGTRLLVTNMFNDSISIIDTATNTVITEYDLRPYNTSGADGVAGGEQPYDVAVAGNTAYVTSVRDREIVVLDISGAAPAFVKRIAVPGTPNHVALSPGRERLYVSQDVQDYVAVIDTATNTVLENIDTRAPDHVIPGSTRFTGASPTSVTVSPDGRTLFVPNGGSNSVAIIPLSGPAPHRVAALVPTGWFPQSVALSVDGKQMYIVNGKSDQGPNPGNLFGATDLLTQTTYPGGNVAANTAAAASNQYQLQLHRSALVSAPVPARRDYGALTAQVAANNFYSMKPVKSDAAKMSALHDRIQHIIYIIKENRTFDQILGDLNNGANGDPSLAVFGREITPNFHRLANRFVTLDNFFDPGDASMNGWSWSTQAAATDQVEKAQQLNYSGRGLSYDTEGAMRNVGIGLPLELRETSPGFAAGAGPGGVNNLLPGPGNVARMDSGNIYQGGTFWSEVLRAGLTVRNYGFWVSNIPTAPLVRDPFSTGNPVVVPLDPLLSDKTDVYFRGFDQRYPDVWLVEEWQREFAQYEANGNLPSLELLRLAHDHTGSYTTAVGGFNTPETQQADNDLAVARVVQTIATSPKYSGNTLIFVVEDDPQDGPDHMDSHRSTAYVVGPYVEHNELVSTRYTTVNMIRTMEDILGVGHLNLNDDLQRPMADVFDLSQASWSYSPVASTVLKTTMTSIERRGEQTQFAEGPDVKPTHDAAYWDNATKGFDFSAADRAPTALFNRILWEGLMGDKPYPSRRDGQQMGTTHEASLQGSVGEKK